MAEIDPDMRGAAEALVSGIERRIKDETERLRAKMTDIVERLKADPITDPAHTSQLIVEAVREIERLRFALRTVLGDADHGQNMTWEERIRIGREALPVTASQEQGK